MESEVVRMRKEKKTYYFSVERDTEGWYLECSGSLTHRKQYLDWINRTYEERFASMDEYKREGNFKRILSKLTLDNVRAAIRRAKTIMQGNEEKGFVLQRYKGFAYYRENPSLSVWESIEGILEDCRLA